VDTPAGKMPVILKASLESDGKLNLSSTRTFKTPHGEVSIVAKEIWELTDDGKTLKVTREIKGPSGTNKREMFFTKK
jgi:hypothetical protein